MKMSEPKALFADFLVPNSSVGCATHSQDGLRAFRSETSVMGSGWNRLRSCDVYHTYTLTTFRLSEANQENWQPSQHLEYNEATLSTLLGENCAFVLLLRVEWVQRLSIGCLGQSRRRVRPDPIVCTCKRI